LNYIDLVEKSLLLKKYKKHNMYGV